MLFPDFLYVEIVTDSIQNRNKVVKLSDVNAAVSGSSGSECYRSFYRFKKDFPAYVREKKSVSGYSGEAYTDYVWFDIDRADLNEALEAARHFVNRVVMEYDVDPDSLRLYFSGAKGFHVGVNAQLFGLTPSRDLPTRCKAIAKLMAGDMEIDLAVYDKTRIFRLSGTVNAKTGLYKIPLTFEELMTLGMNDIKIMAGSPREVEYVDSSEDIETGRLAFLDKEKEKPPKPQRIENEPQIRKQALHGTKICLHRIMSGVDEGLRDECAIRLAADYHKKGTPPEVATVMLRAWNELNRPPLDDSVIMTKILSAYGSTVYDFGCNDSILQKFCHEDCFLFEKQGEHDSIKVYTPADLIQIYKEYVRHISTRKIELTMMPNIAKKVRGLRPGEVAVIMARPAVGKSLVAQSIIHDICHKQKIWTIFFSLEMPKEQVYERGASIEMGESTETIEKLYLEDKTGRVDSKMEDLKGLYIVEKSNLSLGEIQSIVSTVGEVGFIVIDYMSLVRAPGGNLYERTSYVARHLKELAKETGAAVLMISQVSREGGDGTEEITLSMGRDSGGIEEGADVQIGMWRDPEDLKVIVCRLLKGRRGGAGTTDWMTFAGESVKIVPAETRLEE